MKPSSENPVRVLLALPDGKVLNIEAIDLSGSGISFIVPDGLTYFKIGNYFSMIITLPGGTRVPATVLVRHTTQLYNMLRIGLEYYTVTEENISLLTNYASLREEEIRTEHHKKHPLKKTRISLVEQGKFHERFDFLDGIFEIMKSDPPVSLDTLIAYKPDVIVLSDRKGDALTIAKLVRAKRALKTVPIILLTQQDREDLDLPQETVILGSPYHERLLVSTIDNLGRKYRFFRQAQQQNITVVSGERKKALVIDRFHHFGKDCAEALKTCGFKVNMRRKEEDTLGAITRLQPDVILIDEEMERTDPVSLCRQINADSAIRAIPRIILTNQKHNWDLFYSQGLFSTYLVKPLKTEELIAKVLEAASSKTP